MLSREVRHKAAQRRSVTCQGAELQALGLSVFRQVKTVLGMTAIPLHSLVDFNNNFTKRESYKSRNKVRDVLMRGLKKKKFCL